MKKVFKSVTVLFLVVCIALGAVGCGKQEKSNTVSNQTNNDDFFGDTESVISSSSKEDVSSTESKVKTEKKKAVSTKNKTGGKSFEDVLASMPKSLKGSTVVMYNWNPASEYTGATVAIQEFENKTGIKVKWNTIDYKEYFTKLAALVASGESPDVVRTRTPVSTNMLSFQPLSNTGFDFSDEAWDKRVMQDYTIGKNVYATSLKNTHIGSVTAMFYNKALIEQYSLDDPYKLWKSGKWTWNKFISMCKTFRNDSGNNIAAAGNGWDTYATIYGLQGPLTYKNGKYTNTVSDAKFLKVMQEFGDLFNTERLIQRGLPEVFDRGELLFFAGGAIYGRRMNAYFASLKAAGTLYMVPMPSVDGQKTYYQGLHEYEAYAVAKGAKNAKAVPYFLRYFLDSENYDMSSFFCNNQILEVYNWCMNQKNTVWTNGIYASAITGADANDTFGKIDECKGSQVKSFIDSNKAFIDKRAIILNDAVKKLK